MSGVLLLAWSAGAATPDGCFGLSGGPSDGSDIPDGWMCTKVIEGTTGVGTAGDFLPAGVASARTPRG